MSGVVYFLSDGELIKVGYATCTAERLHDLQTGNGRLIERLCEAPATLKQEYKLHSLLPARAQGEWFHPSEKLMRLIRRIVATPIGERAKCVPNFIQEELAKKARRKVVYALQHGRLIRRLRAETAELVNDIVAEHGTEDLAKAIGFTDGAVRWWKSGKAMPSALAMARIGAHFPDRVMDLHRPLGQPSLIARAERMGMAA